MRYPHLPALNLRARSRFQLKPNDHVTCVRKNPNSEARVSSGNFQPSLVHVCTSKNRYDCVSFGDFDVRTVRLWGKKPREGDPHVVLPSPLNTGDFNERERGDLVLYSCRYGAETDVAKPDHAAHGRVHSACKSRVPTDRDGKRTCNPRAAGRPPV